MQALFLTAPRRTGRAREVGRRRGARRSGPFPTTPSQTGRARFPWHPAFQCLSWLSGRASTVVGGFIAYAADDQGFAVACGHPCSPFGLLLPPFGIEVFECPDMVHLDLNPRTA